MTFSTLVKNEKFSLMYSKDTRIFHFFIYYTGKDFAHQKVLDATGLVWRCATFPTASCANYLSDADINVALRKLRCLRYKKNIIKVLKSLCNRIIKLIK